MKALIIDDEHDIGLMISKILTKEGIETDHTGFIKSARKMIHSKDYSIFFLDLNLPDGSGFELVPEIHKNCIDLRL